MRLVNIFWWGYYLFLYYYFLPLFLLFIQIVYLWILIFHIKVSNFMVDILRLQGNKFLKINKGNNKMFVITIAPPDIHVLINTHVYNVRCTIEICFRLLISLMISADFLFAWDNFVCNFLIFVSKPSTLFVLLVSSTFKLILFWIFFLFKCWWVMVLIWNKCSLLTYINTPSCDYKSTKPVRKRLIHMYLRFFLIK